MGEVKVLAVGTAVPDYCYRQEEIKSVVAELFSRGPHDFAHLLPVFDNARIRRRHFARPLAWYAEARDFAAANTTYCEVALDLAAEAAGTALRKAQAAPRDVGAVIFVSSTGIATPSLDAALVERLGISRQAVRLPVWGLGCAGGAVGLARGAELVQVHGGVALVVAVELCSVTFQPGDYSKANLVGTGIFADGAAATVLATGAAAGDRAGAEVLGSYSHLFENSADVMGWDVVPTGLKVRFSRDIPTIVRKFLPGLLRAACSKWGVDRSAVKHFVFHPGGAKVLAAYADSLDLEPGVLAPAYQVLEEYGNMSSPSVLFVLERFLATNTPRGDYGVMMALGPGFCAEQVLFRW